MKKKYIYALRVYKLEPHDWLEAYILMKEEVFSTFLKAKKRRLILRQDYDGIQNLDIIIEKREA